MVAKQISSVQNPLVKQLVLLKSKSRERQKSGIFVVEGLREITLALRGHYNIETLLFCPQLGSLKTINTLKNRVEQLIEISIDVYKKIAHRSTTEGLLAIVQSKTHDLESLILSTKTPLILVAEATEKPGNIGALLRTSDAANLDAVIIANPKTDLYNPNTIRSSVGTIFTNQIATGHTQEIINFLNKKNINIYCATLEDAIAYHTQDYTPPSAIILGTEDKGLSNDWLNNATQRIHIPMQGEIDSMNVSVAAGVIIFEAKRQRNFC